MQNKVRLEGSIAEGYVVEEAIIFSCQYLQGVESKFSMRLENGGEIFRDIRSYVLELFRPVGHPIKKFVLFVCTTISKGKVVCS